MFGKKKIVVPVEVSARHCHLSKQDFEKLFGAGKELNKVKQLTQPSDFACAETVDITFNSKVLKNLRIIGPFRNQTQIEISRTDAIFLGADAPIRLSGELQNSAPVFIAGPADSLELNEGLIIARRHLHCSKAQAAKLGLKNGFKVNIGVAGDRPVIFEDVSVRVGDNYELCMHIDTDEGNAAGINKVGQGKII